MVAHTLAKHATLNQVRGLLDRENADTTNGICVHTDEEPRIETAAKLWTRFSIAWKNARKSFGKRSELYAAG